MPGEAMVLLSLAQAWGFCGAFVGAPGSELVNHTSRIIVARQGDHTVLTLAADVEGSLAEAEDTASTPGFGVVIPVPASLTEHDVSVVSPELVDFVDAFSSPRAVAYSCDDLVTQTHHWAPGGPLGCSLAFSCSDNSFVQAPYSDEADESVTVEAAFSEAEYDLLLLSAEDGAGLQSWLDDHGWTLPEDTSGILQDYVDGGFDFLAARVDLAELPAGRTTLHPLQLRYDDPTFTVPIRIGTVTGAEIQEVLLYVFTEGSEVAISSYPELEIDRDCMYPEDVDLGAHYTGQVDAALATQDSWAGWVNEYSWDLAVKCDPCTTEQQFSDQDLYELGYQGSSPHLTRLRLVYAREAAAYDIGLYESGLQGQQSQLRYVQYLAGAEELFPICDEGWADDPGTCLDEDAGCQVAPVVTGSLAPLAFLLPLVGLRRRR